MQGAQTKGTGTLHSNRLTFFEERSLRGFPVSPLPSPIQVVLHQKRSGFGYYGEYPHGGHIRNFQQWKSCAGHGSTPRTRELFKSAHFEQQRQSAKSHAVTAEAKHFIEHVNRNEADANDDHVDVILKDFESGAGNLADKFEHLKKSTHKWARNTMLRHSRLEAVWAVWRGLVRDKKEARWVAARKRRLWLAQNAPKKMGPAEVRWVETAVVKHTCGWYMQKAESSKLNMQWLQSTGRS
eukprot:SAG31_NODE_20_length_34168_cov_33.651296_41_plen_239_part_00